MLILFCRQWFCRPLHRLQLALLLATLFLQQAASANDYRVETIGTGLPNPWSLAFLPDGKYLVSMRIGELWIIDAEGQASKVQNTPATFFAGQGGYFDVLLDRDFASNQTLYLALASGGRKANATQVIRAKLNDASLGQVKEIFTVTPQKDTSAHYGGRLLQLSDGSLLLTTGDGFQYREAAQDKSSQLGKVVRFNPDGSLPADNPFSDSKGSERAVWTFGHRNPQGLAADQANGKIYLHEHGPRGGDEINLLERGSNYGWPAVTHGINYSGELISPFTTAPGMRDPLHVWVPSIAPSGFAIYRGTAFPDWQGKMFVGALVDREVRVLEFNDDGTLSESAILGELDRRIRDIREGPDGFVYLLTDGQQGELLRLVPATPRHRQESENQ